MTAEDIKKDFPLLKDNDISYLDSGATTHKPKQVIDAISSFYNKYNSNPHRGSYMLSVKATQIYEDTRKKVKQFINAKHTKEIIFTKNATESLNLIAYSYAMENLKKDDEIVISNIVDESATMVYKKIKVDSETLNPEMLEELNQGIKANSKEELNLIIEDIES
jgi:cysteine desulfurase/selenocysteine lyase